MKTTTILLSFLLVSCTHSIKEYPYTLVETSEEIILEIDSDTKFLTKALFCFTNEDGNEILSFENENKLLFYQLKDGDLIRKIYLEYEGPNGVGTVFGHYPQTLDSIYITRRNIPELYLIDSEGIILDKYVFTEDIQGQLCTHAISSSSVYCPLVITDKEIHLNQFLLTGGNTTGDMLEENPLSVIINKQTKEVKKSKVNYPRLWNDVNDFGIAEYSRTFDGEKFIYSFFWDEHIYITDMAHTRISGLPGKSNYIQKLDKEKKRAQDYHSGLKFSIETAKYGNIIYDPYREIYYRFSYPATKLSPKEDLQIAATFQKEFSIIIFNKDLEIIGETLFPDEKYVPSLFFVASDGFYMSTNHILNPDFNEDQLVFKQFILSQSNNEREKTLTTTIDEHSEVINLNDTTIYLYPDIFPELLNQDEIDKEKKHTDWPEEKRVAYSFIVETDGSISGVKLENGDIEELNKETLRLLKMARFKPGQLKDGTLVRSKSIYLVRYP